MINCDQAKLWIKDGVQAELTATEQAALDAHIAACIHCQQYQEHVNEVRQWLHTDQAPEPSAQMHARFYEMLYAAGPSAPPEKTKSELRHHGHYEHSGKRMIWLRAAATLLLLSCGGITGYWMRGQHSGDEIARQQLDSVRVQLQEMRQIMMFSLLENPSASERLQAVSISNEMGEANEKVITALLATLNHDTNVNVRLVTLEALIRYADNPAVREGLIQSLPAQDSPLVQMAMADLMVKLQEKRSVNGLRQMLRQKGMREPVKARVEQSINKLS